VTTAPDNLPDEIAALTAALAAERTARQEAEARASSAEALVAHLKLLIAKLKREQYGQSSERGRRLLDQLELQLELIQPHAQNALDLLVKYIEQGAELPPDQCIPRGGAIASSPAQPGHCSSLFVP
jgi:transposase